LQDKYVVQVPVVPIRPDIVASHGVDQLSRYSQAAAELANATFNDKLDFQFTTDALYIYVLVPVLER